MHFRTAAHALLAISLVSSAAAAPVPTANFVQPSTDALVGGTFQFCVTFENTGTDPGYGPFVDLFIRRDPAIGQNAPCDGMTIVSAVVTSTTPNVPLTPIHTHGSCPSNAGTYPHPLSPVLPVTLAAGEEMVTFALPFGSYQPSPQPKITIEVTGQVNQNADITLPLPMTVRGGFRWNPTLTQTPMSATANPRVIILHSAFGGADQETVPGPHFPQQYTVTADVAPGAVLNGMTIQDCLPVGGIWTTAPGTINGPCWSVNNNSVTGSGPGTLALQGTAWFNNTTLGAGCSTTATNTASVLGGTWIPHDPQDPPYQLSLTPPATTNIKLKAIAIQKQAQSGPTIPGSTITYTENFQVSDYRTLGSLFVNDWMSDGLQFVNASLTASDQNGSVSSVPVVPSATTNNVTQTFNCPPPPAGPPCAAATASAPSALASTQYGFDISAALVAGGHVPSLTGAHGTLTVTANVLDTFLYKFNTHVVKDDPLLNRADISAAGQKFTCSDDSYSCLAVPTDILHKEVFAKNGSGGPWPPLAGPHVTAGDKVQFHLSKSIPSGDYDQMTIQDFFPLPIFMPVNSGVLLACMNPDCYSSVFPMIGVTGPTPPDNSLTYDFNSWSNTANTALPLDLYTTQTVTNQPFPDGLLFTNEAQECESNSYGTKFCQAAIAELTLDEPYLEIHKGVCGGQCPPPSIKCGFCPTGAFNATTAANLIGSPKIFADANDTVYFALEVVNTGHHDAYDIRISDQLPSGFPGQIDYTFLCVKRGDTVPVPSTFTASSPTSFTISLPNPLPGSVVGSNVILIIYRVKLNAAKFVHNGCFDNDASIAHYSNQPGGPDFVAAGFVGPHAVAEVCIAPHGLTKSFVSSSEADPAPPNVTIGNMLWYQLKFIVPQGVSTFNVVDTLPAGFNFQLPSVTITGIGFTPNLSSYTLVSTNPLTFGFTGLKNFASSGCQYLVIRFRVEVLNNALNHDGDQKDNSFKIGSETSNVVTLHVVEPKLKVVKSVTPVIAPFPGGVQYTIHITNISNATAFDVTVNDPLPSCVAYSNGTLTLNGNPIPGTPTSIAIPSLLPGHSATITFIAIEHCDCAHGTNTATVRWTSEPGLRGTNNATPGTTCTPTGERCYSATATASVCAHICGVKFADLNGNHVQDPNEPGLANWPVTATGISGTTSATTDVNGHYCLDLPVDTNNPTTYNICEGTLQGWTPTTPNCKSVTAVMNTTTTVDFGNQPHCSATLCGKKLTTTGQPVAGWGITATPPAGPVITATTDATGSYCMTLFGPGSYTITEETKTGWLQVSPTPSYSVKVDCGPAGAGPGVITGVNPNHADFTNRNVCANVTCPAQTHCDVGPNGGPACVSNIINK